MDNLYIIATTQLQCDVGTCLWHVSIADANAFENMPKGRALKKSKRGILEPLETAYCG